MAHLDYKITTWKRLFIPDEKIDEVVKKLKDGSPYDLYDLNEIEGVYLENSDIDVQCEEHMLVEENNNASTQELYNSAGEIIYQNGTDY
jgi:hypothetical protein